MTTTPARPKAVDLFAGAGGLSLGFEQAGFDVVAAVELDPIHCGIHRYNFPQCAVLCQSAADVTAASLRSLPGVGDSPIDVVVGGAPCQGFSLMGKRALDDPRNGLVRHFLRLVVELEATYFVFENVRGLTIGQHRRFLDELIAEFKTVGYNVVSPWQVLNAADYGVPQNRHRLFLIGARDGAPLPAYPAPLCRAAGAAADLLALPPGPTVSDALGDLPDAERFDELRNVDSVKVVYGPPAPYAARLRGVLPDPDDFSHPRRFDSELMTSSLRAEHTPKSRERFAATPPGETEPVSRFFKLDPQGICNTLRAGTASDRGAFTSPRPIHPTSHRCITVREMARLHSYPDWFRFHATKWHGARQIGNSVPPLLARAVARTLMAAMEHRPVRPAAAIELGDEKLLRLDMKGAAALNGVPADTIAQRTRKAPTPLAGRNPA